MTRVRLAGGLTVIYKPRPVTGEILWGRLLAWLGRRIGWAPFLLPRVLERPGYGWIEALPSERPRSDGEARGWHTRFGAMLALAEIFELRDMHRDNVRAVGSEPVLVDAETLAHPRLRGFGRAPSLALTGGLPGPGDAAGRAGLMAGVPAGADPIRYLEPLLAGYRSGYRALAQGGAAAGRTLFAALRSLEARTVLRPTARYRAALDGSPARWPGAGTPLPLERGATAVAAAERRMLARGDVPLFHTVASGRDLLLDGEVLVRACFRRAAADRIDDRLSRLGPADERRSADLIRLLSALRETGGRNTAGRDRGGRRSRSR